MIGVEDTVIVKVEILKPQVGSTPLLVAESVLGQADEGQAVMYEIDGPNDQVTVLVTASVIVRVAI